MSDIINRTDLGFLLRDWLQVDDLFAREEFVMHSYEAIDAVLDVVERIGRDILAPALRSADQNEPWIDAEGGVRVDPAMRAAVLAIAESGLFGAIFEERDGGLQLPFLVYAAGMSILFSANSSAAFYAMLTVGNARLIAEGASRTLFEAFGSAEVAGRSFGTMCLSEPHAGSSLGDIITRAVPDGRDNLGERFRLSGGKMWISGGDQNVSENIVHLVLAKVPGEDGVLPKDSRGISLFLVPKILPNGELNDVAVAGLNHKMGSRGLPNCALNFGEGRTKPEGTAGALGWIVGEVGQGLALMFQMMNEARISVGLASAMIAYRGFLLSLGYARDRCQGRLIGVRGGSQVPIIMHPDVKRLLLVQKAIAEGGLALVLYAARLQDEVKTASTRQAQSEAQALLDLLTPIVKSWPSEFGQVALSCAMQVLGGAGYTRDFEVELLYRDNRLNPIHEGTTGIQAVDLVVRKLRKEGGAAYACLRRRVEETLIQAAKQQLSARVVEAVRNAWGQIDAAVARLRAYADDGAVGPYATDFLTAMGHGVIGWIWLDVASLAKHQLETGSNDAPSSFYVGKIKACAWFAECELPHVAAWLAPLMTDGETAATFAADEFLGEVA
jgi:alkylation response protein AidB-like acyl-CoA dehydrogenase